MKIGTRTSTKKQQRNNKKNTRSHERNVVDEGIENGIFEQKIMKGWKVLMCWMMPHFMYDVVKTKDFENLADDHQHKIKKKKRTHRKGVIREGKEEGGRKRGGIFLRK